MHDGSKIGWAEEFDALPEWADHQIIQRKLRAIAPAADAVNATWRGPNSSQGQGRLKPTVNDELSYQGAGDHHTETDVIASHLGAFLGGGYATTGEKHGRKLGQYFWGAFDPDKHSAADNLLFLRQTIDRKITFWKLAPDQAADVFGDLDPRFRVLSWPGREYVLGTDAKAELTANLPAGRWDVARYDLVQKTSQQLASGVEGNFNFTAPSNRPTMFHFKRTSDR